MKIAMVSATADLLPVADLPATDQQGVYLVEVATALALLGHEITIYLRRADNSFPDRVILDSGVAIQQVPVGPGMSDDEFLREIPHFAASLTALWKVHLPDVVHSHGWLAGLAALIAARDSSIRLAHSFHELGINAVSASPAVPVQQRRGSSSLRSGRNTPADSSTRLRLERAIGHDVDRVVALSNAEDQQLARIGLRGPKVSIVPSGVDIEVFRSDGHVADRTVRVRLVAVGPLIASSGFDVAIKALKRVPEAELFIVGGPQRSELDTCQEAQRLKEIAERIGVLDRVEFCGQARHSELADIFRSIDLLVAPQSHEPFSMIALEAMACGVPVVASSVGAFLDTVVDGATGALVRPDHPDELAVKLRELVSNPFQREGYSVAGIDRIKSRYTWHRVAQDLHSVYCGLIGVNSEPASEQPPEIPDLTPETDLTSTENASTTSEAAPA